MSEPSEKPVPSPHLQFEQERDPDQDSLHETHVGISDTYSVLQHEKVAWYLRVPFASSKTVSGPVTNRLEDAPVTPEATAGFFSKLTFTWLTPILRLGYSRPLEALDLYKLQDSRAAAKIGNQIVESFDRRRKVAELYNERLLNGDVKAGWRVIWWSLTGSRTEKEKNWRERDGQKKPSLILSMNESVMWWFWTAGILKLIADVATITSPLFVKAIIDFATESYNAHSQVPRGKYPPIGKGIGLAFGLFFLQLVSSLCQNHSFYRSTTTGVMLRGGIIATIFSRSLRLTSRSRTKLTNSKLMTLVGTDVSRIDFAVGFFHLAWTAPIQIVICLIQLLLNLGPSALAGFAVFILSSPLQRWIMKRQFFVRTSSMQWTDKRIKLIQELLGGMKVIKFFAWEVPFLSRLVEIRKKEVQYIRKLLVIRSSNNAIAFSLPVLATVLAFITYTLTGHTMNATIVFSSLTLFQLLRTPLMLLPVSLNGTVDAYNATLRLYDVFVAETLSEMQITESDLDVAIEVKGGEFTWDGAPPAEIPIVKHKRRWRKAKKLTISEGKEVETKDQENFKLLDINLSVPRGSLCAIVGPVGSGKSSLLQALVGEMRKTSGTVKFGGSVSYCPQSPWIQNSSIRENICFGRPFDSDRYWRAVRDSCLIADFAMLPHSDMTEVGEKGISLSGGQKARLNIARAIYCDADIEIFDDPLSALDAHVGKDVFKNVLQNSPQGKTRILVTHALHFLPQTDYIITMVDGRIAERGTYTELVANENGAFSKSIKEFDIQDEEETKEEDVQEEAEVQEGPTRKRKAAPALMQAEERAVGSVSGEVYRIYAKAGNGKLIIPLLFAALFLVQVANIMSSYWLVYWQERKWDQPQGFYIGIYSALGVFQAVVYFLQGSGFAFQAYFTSKNLHRDAIERIMHAPMSFFDTTPLGRILNRLSKDIDTIDNFLSDSWNAGATSVSQILGAVVLISVIFPWFLLPVAVISVCYFYFALFYRASSTELQRLNSLLRSTLYSHFSESLSGLVTIRAYGESDRFRTENETYVDNENRPYWLTVTNQRWLAVRLDFLGAILTFLVALLAVLTRFTISPSQTGVSLSYILLIQQSFSLLVRQAATIETNMNSVERVVHYANHIEQEAPHEEPKTKPASTWPAEGQIVFDNVYLSYRPALPPVLKGLDMVVAGGEKIGIVGRTGAGKSSIMTALYRLVEIGEGKISIDGVDISTIGLTDLRQSIAIIPQEALLFSGTLRSNLDPFGTHDDARLWDALQRSYLVKSLEKDATQQASAESHTNRFSLDMIIEDEGNNLSAGQRSLVSLARALVKNSKVLVLDEATASVDYETDKHIQETISNEFRNQTILCIAHRLHTIISYDRICVLDAGRIAELDTPTSLYAQDGIFRSLCDESGISLADIQHAADIRAGRV